MGKKTKKRVKSFCNKCRLDANQDVLFSHDERFRDEEQGVEASTSWQILSCCGCDTVSFREVEEFSEDYDPETGQIIPTIRCYPILTKNSIPTQAMVNVPRKIRGIYRESIEAYNRDSRLLCAGGIRAAIDGVCSDKRIINGPVTQKKKGGGTQVIRGKNLNGRINGLHERGLITEALRDSLHEHRFLGNEALHELETPEREELAIAIGLLEQTLNLLYEVSDRVAELKALKKKRKRTS